MTIAHLEICKSSFSVSGVPFEWRNLYRIQFARRPRIICRKQKRNKMFAAIWHSHALVTWLPKIERTRIKNGFSDDYVVGSEIQIKLDTIRRRACRIDVSAAMAIRILTEHLYHIQIQIRIIAHKTGETLFGFISLYFFSVVCTCIVRYWIWRVCLCAYVSLRIAHDLRACVSRVWVCMCVL